MDHILFSTLVDYAENRLSPTERDRVTKHIEVCDVCREELERVRRVFADVSGASWESPANHLVTRVLSAFHRKAQRQTQRATNPVHLNLDSWAQLAALGIRGTPKERQFLFSEDAFDLDVQIVKETAAQDFVLQGQLLSNHDQDTDLQGIEVHLVGPSDIDRRGLTDYLGRFSFVGLEAGTYTLKLILDDRDLLVETLPLEIMPIES